MSAECSAENIPPGYKQTEVGVIPEDWEVLPLSEISKRITDGEHLTPRRSNSGYYLLSARNILNGRISLLEVDYVGESEYRRIRQRCNPEAGDVLISCSGTIGRVAILPKGLECVMVRSAALVKPDAEKLSGLYAQYFLQFPAGQKQIFASLNQGAQANLFLNHIQGLHVALPPTLAEQESIAEAISDTDAFIESLEQLIAKKRQIKQGAMQELLTGKRRLPGFEIKQGYKQTEVGVIPEDWRTPTLESLTVLMTNGFVGTATTHYASNDNGILYIQGYNVEENSFNFHGIKFVTEDFHSTHMKSCLRGGDLLTVQTGDVGLTTVVPESLAGSNCHALIISRFDQKQVFSTFISYYLNSKPGRSRLKLIEIGTTMKHLNVGDMLQFTIPLPPSKAEQEAIASILSDMDSEITILEEKLAKARQVKQGMMQELLTGKIRLI